MKLRVALASTLHCALLGVVLLALITAGVGQHHRQYPTPPPPADATTQSSQSDFTPKVRPNAAQLREETKELSSLAQNLRQDIDSVNRGLLPKDTVSKLKRIEKLAKHLRQEIAP